MLNRPKSRNARPCSISTDGTSAGTHLDDVALAACKMLSFNTGATDGDAQQKALLNQFLADIEGRAFTMANIATHNRDDALDIVQDAMISLVTRYSKKPADQWRPLFYRILNNKINDCHRRRSSRSRFHFWGGDADDVTEHDVASDAPDPSAGTDDAAVDDQTRRQIEHALQQLPARQQQAFMLRMWEGLSVRETAIAMSCSEGSVKTHLSRAMSTMRQLLEAHHD